MQESCVCHLTTVHARTVTIKTDRHNLRKRLWYNLSYSHYSYRQFANQSKWEGQTGFLKSKVPT